ncbi:hypothetical protein M3M38_00805 [Fructilactobacillus cliffordii]|uniref:hypothetical protein n=1 Tax=Fructilactobacillus cliffordii TaxID=2940299 RepID=UPI002093322A|nr:hypothetical protein [Fructilactobacillus cliffordii]USS86652.1 hypothetical protein M3M38_00805 [Fructilactobacillus cliffordii]
MGDKHNWNEIHDWLKHEYEAGHFQQPYDWKQQAGFTNVNYNGSTTSKQKSDWELGSKHAQQEWQMKQHYQWQWIFLGAIFCWINPLFRGRFQEIIDYITGYKETWKRLKQHN